MPVDVMVLPIHSGAGFESLRQLFAAGPCGPLIFRFASATDAEYVTIRVAKVHLADAPLHIGRRKGHLLPGGHALPVHLVHIGHPDRHPDALVAPCVTLLLERGRVRTASTTSLRPLKRNYSPLTLPMA